MEAPLRRGGGGQRAEEPGTTGGPRMISKIHIVVESHAVLESPSRSGGSPVTAGSPLPSTPEPRPAASRPLRPARAAAPRPRPGLRLAGSWPTSPAPPGLSVPSYLAGSRGGVAPHVPVPHLPVLHAAVRPHRAAATAASELWPHRPGSREGSGGGCGANSRSAPHRTHLPKTGNGCSTAANSRSAVTRGRGQQKRQGSLKPRGGSMGRGLLASNQ